MRRSLLRYQRRLSNPRFVCPNRAPEYFIPSAGFQDSQRKNGNDDQKLDSRVWPIAASTLITGSAIGVVCVIIPNNHTVE